MARLKAARIAFEFIRQTSSRSDNIILGGDFNVDPFEFRDGQFIHQLSGEYRLFTEKLGLIDGYAVQHGLARDGFTDDRKNFYAMDDTDPPRRIDWILYRGPLFEKNLTEANLDFKDPVTAAEAVENNLPNQPPQLSDHWGLKYLFTRP